MRSEISVETETKLELSEEEFSRLLSLGTIRKKVAQLNVYFDSDWRLASLEGTCRIRIGSGQARLTVKLPLERGAFARVMREVEAPIELRSNFRVHSPWRHGLDVERDLPTEVRADFRAAGLRKLQCQGWSRNTRYIVSLVNLGEIELDRLRLPDGETVFEAEIEHDDLRVHKRLMELIRSVAPSAQVVKVSKFERFRRALARRVEKSNSIDAASDRLGEHQARR